MPGKTARVQYSGPRRLTSRVCHQLSGSVAASGPTGPNRPTLLTSRSTGPIASSAAATMLSTCWRSVTSHRMASACPPRPSISPATPVTSSSERAQTATAAPASPRARAMARPIPRPAPVTSATCPSRRTAGRSFHRAAETLLSPRLSPGPAQRTRHVAGMSSAGLLRIARRPFRAGGSWL